MDAVCVSWKRNMVDSVHCWQVAAWNPDSFHLPVLPPLEPSFLLMDREALQTPPSPSVPAWKAQEGGREKKVHSCVKASPGSRTSPFCSHTIGQYLVTQPPPTARKAGVLVQAAVKKTLDWVTCKRQKSLSHSSESWKPKGASVVGFRRGSSVGCRLLAAPCEGEQGREAGSLLTLKKALTLLTKAPPSSPHLTCINSQRLYLLHWPVWPGWLECLLQIGRLRVWLLVRTHAWVSGSVSSLGVDKR